LIHFYKRALLILRMRELNVRDLRISTAQELLG